MAHPLVIKAVSDRLAAGFIEPDCPIVGINERPSAGRSRTAFVTLQFPYSTSAPATLGAPGGQWWMEEGAFRFVVIISKGEGIARGLEWAERIASLFRGEEFDEIVCFAAGSPNLDDHNDGDAFFRFSFTVAYEFQFQQRA
ncbi:hypothetical protein NS226_07160 [Aureimonas ureilytica]|uniref:DUF3168 domain-containing protein n=1 Tax=Aureimonas ureilytica TaxID=401562 RepID=A0A175RB75_9HYPH|nr:hypothetical protein [Aureimonas ureilytica]KTQ96575.1 hypothetical protein NS226_07160 [Aureimonas ureilytica]